MAGEIIGSDAQFNEDVDILGKLNLFDSINQVINYFYIVYHFISPC